MNITTGMYQANGGAYSPAAVKEADNGSKFVTIDDVIAGIKALGVDSVIVLTSAGCPLESLPSTGYHVAITQELLHHMTTCPWTKEMFLSGIKGGGVGQGAFAGAANLTFATGNNGIGEAQKPNTAEEVELEARESTNDYSLSRFLFQKYSSQYAAMGDLLAKPRFDQMANIRTFSSREEFLAAFSFCSDTVKQLNEIRAGKQQRELDRITDLYRRLLDVENAPKIWYDIDDTDRALMWLENHVMNEGGFHTIGNYNHMRDFDYAAKRELFRSLYSDRGVQRMLDAMNLPDTVDRAIILEAMKALGKEQSAILERCARINREREIWLNRPNPALAASFPHLAMEVMRINADINNSLRQFYTSGASLDDLKNIFDSSFERLKRVHIEAGLTNGLCRDDNARILADVLHAFNSASETIHQATSDSMGTKLAGPEFTNHGNGMFSRNWIHYNAELRYKIIELREFLLSHSGAVAKEQNLDDPMGYYPGLMHPVSFPPNPALQEYMPPPRDFWFVFDTRNNILNVAGTKFSFDELTAVNNLDELENLLLGRGVSQNHLFVMKCVVAGPGGVGPLDSLWGIVFEKR
jgi:hypothetical protein